MTIVDRLTVALATTAEEAAEIDADARFPRTSIVALGDAGPMGLTLWHPFARRSTGTATRPAAADPQHAIPPDRGSGPGHRVRTCKRCRPSARPGSPEWNVRADLMGVDRSTVEVDPG
jgi:hypothetical protein